MARTKNARATAIQFLLDTYDVDRSARPAVLYEVLDSNAKPSTVEAQSRRQIIPPLLLEF